MTEADLDKKTQPLGSPELTADLTNRLRRIEGQVRGVQRMVGEGRDCPEVLQQMAAVRSALHQASLILVRAYLAGYLSEDSQEDTSAALDRVMKALSKLD